MTDALALSTYDSSNPTGQQAAIMAGQLINIEFGRDDDLEFDQLGLRFMSEAGYNPRALIVVMRSLEEAGGGARQPAY